jgi:hypothetical protein
VCIALAVGIQHFGLLRSVTAVVAAAVIVGAGAILVTRSSLSAFAVAMRYHHGLASADVGPMFQEIEG